MKKNNFLKLIGLLFLVTLFSCSKSEKRPPNVIIIFTDDQGYSDVGAYGAEGFKTPHLDAMASEGIKFNDFYSTKEKSPLEN